MQKKRVIGGLIAFGAIALAPFTMAGACDPSQQSGPDPVPANVKPPKVVAAYQLPDGFRNVVVFCDGPNSLAITSRGSDLAGGQNGGGLTSTVTVVKLDDQRCMS